MFWYTLNNIGTKYGRQLQTIIFAQSAGAVEYTDCNSAEG